MKRAVTLSMLVLLLPMGALAQIDIGVAVGPHRPRDEVGAIAGGLSFAIGAFGQAAAVEARDAAIAEASTSELLFVSEDSAIDPDIVANASGTTLIETVRLDSVGLTMVTVRLAKGDTVAAAIARLSVQPGVLWAQPNHLYQVMGEAAAVPRRFALHHIPFALQVSATIAIIDTPVALMHPALRGTRLREEPLLVQAQPGQHGTAIASLLVGIGQVPGVAPGAQLVSLPAFTEQQKGPALSQTRYLAKALDTAVKLKPAVLSLSWGGADDRLLTRLLDAAHSKGICVAAAAGNGGKTGTIPFPASHPASLAITAVDEKLRAYTHATPGNRIDVAGIGVNLLAAGVKGYRPMSGTSFATAVVAGALLRAPMCAAAGQQVSDLRAAAAAQARDLGAPGKDAIFGAGLFQLPQ